MKVSTLIKKLTDHLVDYGDDDIYVKVKPELESYFQPFTVEHATDKDGEQLALLSVPPSVLLENDPPASEKSEGTEETTNSFQQLVKNFRDSQQELCKDLPAAIRGFAVSIADIPSESSPERSDSEESALIEKVKEAVKKDLLNAIVRQDSRLEKIAKSAVDEALTEF